MNPGNLTSFRLFIHHHFLWLYIFLNLKFKIQKNKKPKKVPQRQLEKCGLAICLYTFVVVVQSLSHIQLFVTPWATAGQPPLSFTISQSLLKLMSIESVMPSNQLILCCPLIFGVKYRSLKLWKLKDISPLMKNVETLP